MAVYDKENRAALPTRLAAGIKRLGELAPLAVRAEDHLAAGRTPTLELAKNPAAGRSLHRRRKEK